MRQVGNRAMRSILMASIIMVGMVGIAGVASAQNANAVFQRGVQLCNAGQYAEAEKQFIQADRLAPNNASVLAYLGYVQNGQQKYRPAEANYRKAMALSPNEPSIWSGLGLALNGQGRHGEGTPLLRKTVAANRVNPPPGQQAGMTLAYLGHGEMALAQYAAAEAAYRECLRYFPNNADAWGHLAFAQYMLNKFTQAEATLRKALVLNPNHASNLNNLAGTLVRLGREAEAKPYAVKAQQCGFRGSWVLQHFGLEPGGQPVQPQDPQPPQRQPHVQHPQPQNRQPQPQVQRQPQHRQPQSQQRTPKSGATQSVRAASGGVVSRSGARVTVPAGALASDAQVTVGRLSPLRFFQKGKAVAGDAWGVAVDGSGSQRFSKPVKVQAPLDMSKLPAGTRLNQVSAARWDGRQWTPTPSRVDPSGRMIEIDMMQAGVVAPVANVDPGATSGNTKMTGEYWVGQTRAAAAGAITLEVVLIDTGSVRIMGGSFSGGPVNGYTIKGQQQVELLGIISGDSIGIFQPNGQRGGDFGVGGYDSVNKKTGGSWSRSFGQQPVTRGGWIAFPADDGGATPGDDVSVLF